jgi:hypothetical protein
MDITIHSTFLPHDDPDASLMRWNTVGPADQPGKE